jgi:hypothetical protein
MMQQFIKDILDESPENMTGMAITPVANQLIDVSVVNPILFPPAEIKKFIMRWLIFHFCTSEEDQKYLLQYCLCILG